jgi:hypothetical protein
MVRNYIMSLQKYRWDNAKEIVDIMEEYSLPAYFIVGKEAGWTRGPIQFLLMDEPLNCISYDNFREKSDFEESMIIIPYQAPVKFSPNVEQELLSSHWNIFHQTLIDRNSEETTLGTLKIPSNLFNIKNSDSRAKNGYTICTTSIIMERGSYQCYAQFNLEQSTSDDLGFIEVTVGTQPPVIKNINKDDFKMKEQVFDLMFSVIDETKNVEFRVLTMGGKDITWQSITIQKLSDEPDPYIINEKPHFRLCFYDMKANYSPFYRLGLSGQEPEGVWTLGKETIFNFTVLKSSVDKDLTLTFTVSPLVNDRLPAQKIYLFANGFPLGDMILSQEGIYKVMIPKDCIDMDRLEIKFQLPSATTPNELGINTDTRVLSLFFKELSLSA